MIDAPEQGIPADEEDYLPLSGVQHFVFCQRQCALIHVEGLFVENHFTVEGRLQHAPHDTSRHRARDDVEVETNVWLRSARLGLVGKADRVEIHREQGERRLFPVESKRSRRRSFEADCVQLCAQAMALEETRGAVVTRGALYYIKSRRRLAVDFSPELRQRTTAVARGYHAMVARGLVPRAHLDGRCRACSLRRVCLPAVTERPGALAGYLKRIAVEDPASAD